MITVTAHCQNLILLKVDDIQLSNDLTNAQTLQNKDAIMLHLLVGHETRAPRAKSQYVSYGVCVYCIHPHSNLTVR